MTPKHKQFEVALKAAAQEALSALPAKARVHFALKVILEVNDPAISSTLSFASNRIGEHVEILKREALLAEHGL